MKTIMLFFISAGIAISCSAASNRESGKRSVKCDQSWTKVTQEKKDKTLVSGMGKFKSEEIKKELTVNGLWTFKKVKATKDVTVHGTAEIKDSIFKNLNVYGYVNANNTTFADVKLDASKADFNHSTLDNLTVKNKNQEPEITLTDTTITGNIVFEGKNGKLVLFGDSSVRGTVDNGEVIKK
jgi:hypothetical protein